MSRSGKQRNGERGRKGARIGWQKILLLTFFFVWCDAVFIAQKSSAQNISPKTKLEKFIKSSARICQTLGFLVLDAGSGFACWHHG